MCRTKKHDVKPRLPPRKCCFEEEYQEQTTEAIEAYDRVQTGICRSSCDYHLSQRLAEQFGQPEPSSTRENLEQKELIIESEKTWPLPTVAIMDVPMLGNQPCLTRIAGERISIVEDVEGVTTGPYLCYW